MIKTSCKFLIILTTFLVLGSFSSFAATLTVTKIGVLDLAGKNYTEWWYTGTNPTFQGTAAPNSEVSITIAGIAGKTNSDAQGNWSYATTLQSGDHDVSFSQGSERVSFKLHLGQTVPENFTSQTTQSTTPVTGHEQLVALGMGIGILLLATYFYISGDPRRKSIFEAKILKED